MLPFRLHQLHLSSPDRYLLPLPKLADAQVALVSAHLGERGFSVRSGSRPSKIIASRGSQRITIDGALGLAASGDDMLDALAPAIPALLASGRNRAAEPSAELAALYFSLKHSGASAQLQFFPRMESLRTWTGLRRDGLCGLTPDEAEVIKRLLGKASGSSLLECVTAKPSQASTTIQVGRNIYYKTKLPVSEFLSSLRTIDSKGADNASYLPRVSVISLPGVHVEGRISRAELGEWCFLG